MLHAMHPEIRHLPPMRIACLRHTGALGGPAVGRLWLRFSIWAGNAGLLGPDRTVLGIARDDPHSTPATAMRYDACVQLAPEAEPSGYDLVDQLPGGAYACTRFDGDATQIAAAWAALRSRGAPPGEGRIDASRPWLEWYDRGLELDIKGRFSCLLCVPVRSA